MIFKGVENQSVEFRICNYQFPDLKDGDVYDLNWLDIYIRVKSKLGEWERTDPSLLTGEVEDIIAWLKTLSKINVSKNKVMQWIKELNKENILPAYPGNIIEPNLSFSLVKASSKNKTIRIGFWAESCPPSATSSEEYFVDCELSNGELDRTARELENELKKFPERKV